MRWRLRAQAIESAVPFLAPPAARRPPQPRRERAFSRLALLQTGGLNARGGAGPGEAGAWRGVAWRGGAWIGAVLGWGGWGQLDKVEGDVVMLSGVDIVHVPAPAPPQPTMYI